MKPANFLENLPRKNVYNVPEAYFDKLPNRIMARVTSGPDTTTSRDWLPAPLRLAFAGTGFAVLFAAVFMFNNPDEGNVQDAFAGIEQTEIVEYLLTSNRIDQTDLAILNAADTDYTADFLNATEAEIHLELEDKTIEDLYL